MGEPSPLPIARRFLYRRAKTVIFFIMDKIGNVSVNKL
jgi:hypothetical protein